MTRWLAAAGTASVLALMITTPAGAVAPQPREEQWWFSSWSIEKAVWPISRGAGVTVAVVDSGVNADLPDIRQAVLPGKDIDIADGDLPGSGDGRTDTDAELGGHGTGMAFLIASRGTRTGFYGVAPEAKILPIVTSNVSEAEAIRYAVDHGAQVINVSMATSTLTGECPTDLQQAIGYAVERDVVVVAGAGNDGDGENSPSYPALCAGVLAVGAIDNQKSAWSDTQRQSYVAVAAPGVGVSAIQKDGTLRTGISGTSQATALTSGVVALVRSKYPKMSAREVVQRIYNTAIDAGPRGDDDLTGHGVVYPAHALTKDVPKTAPNPVFEKYDQWAATQPKQAKRESAARTGGENSQTAKKPGYGLVLILGGVAAAVVLVLVAILIAAQRRKGSTPQMPAGVGVPPQSAPYGPPPGWGGPSAQPPADPSQGGHGQQFTPPQR